MIAPTPFDRVQYTLSYMGTESVTIREIRNWGSDEKEYSRNRNYDGIFVKVSNGLEFVLDGREFIKFIYDAYGINADIRIKKEERHPRTDVWTETYSGYLDLSTMEDDGVVLKIKMNSGGVEQILKTREGERVEIDRETSLDGKELAPISTVDVPMDGRKIFLLSKMEDVEKKFMDYTEISTAIVPPMTKTVSSDEHIISTYENFNENYALVRNPSGDYLPEPQQFFYDKNDRLKVLNFEFDLDFNIQIYPGGTQQWPDVYLEIWKYSFDENNVSVNFGYTYLEKYVVHHWIASPMIGVQKLVFNSMGSPYPIPIDKNESLIFVIRRDSPFARTMYQSTNVLMTITEHSFFEPTKCKMVLAHDLGSRLLEIITNKDCFYSKALGRLGLNDYTENGFAEATGMAHGFWIREFFKDETDEENKYKPISTSWRDFMEAMRVTHNLGVGIDLKLGRERVRMEDRSFFFQPKTTIRLPDVVRNIRRSIATEYYYSAIEVGYEKGGEYEESMGLDEYNAKSNFSTIITRIKNIFTIISPFRTDSYGAEFARRKTIKYYPTEDTRYDQDIFQFDLKRLKSSLFIRKWEDDFEEEPKNVYSPETAYNLRYSPANLLFRHRKEIAMGLVKYPMDFVRYGSSLANSKLVTRLKGGEEIAEDGDIQNIKFGNPLAIPEWVEFDHRCNFEVMQQVEGFTNEIPNFYGLVEYRISEDEWERGYLFNLKPNGAGTWKILKLK